MPVRRWRSLDEAERTLGIDPGSAMLWRTIADLWALSDRLWPPRFTPGVYRHRSILEANRLVESWQAAAIRERSRSSVP